MARSMTHRFRMPFDYAQGKPFGEAQGKLVVNISNLSIPERLLALLPLGLILPKIMQRFKIYDLRFMNIFKRGAKK